MCEKQFTFPLKIIFAMAIDEKLSKLISVQN